MSKSFQQMVMEAGKKRGGGDGDDGGMMDFPGQLLIRAPLLMTPLEKIHHFEYYRLLARGIKNMGLEDFNSLQRSVTPHFLRGDDCFIIGGRRSGKTVSYIIPLIGRVLADAQAQENNGERDGRLVEDEGPSVIIVCGDDASSIEVDGYINNLLTSSNQRELSWMRLCERKDIRKYKSQKNVDIVITTAAFLHSVLLKNGSFLTIDRLRYLVFEEVNVLLRAFHDEFEYIHDLLTDISGRHSRYSLQRVFAGTDWCKEVEDLYMSLELISGPIKKPGACFPTLFINSANQVIRYSQTNFVMHHCSEEEKIDALLRILNREDFYQKAIFVACSSAAIAKEVFNELQESNVLALLAESSDMRPDMFDHIKNEWQNFGVNERKIMVINDELIRRINVYDATCLIHFDKPWKSKEARYRYFDRFTCMWKHFRNIVAEKIDRDSEVNYTEALESHFLLTGEEPELCKLRAFTRKLEFVMPESLEQIAVKKEMEEIKKLPLCPGIKQFGRCMDIIPESCKKRHICVLDEIQREPLMPRSGEVEVRIAHCVNPSLYTAQVLRYFPSAAEKRGNCRSFVNQLTDIKGKLIDHFKKEDNRIPPDAFDIGTVCAVENADGIHRARILQILTREIDRFPKQLYVFCIDTGEFLRPLVDSLLNLPDDLRNMPQLAVEIILSNLQPMDGRNDYSADEIAGAEELTVNQILRGKIRFAVGETIWVNPMMHFTNDKGDSNLKTRSSIRLTLISRGIAANNDDHMAAVLTLCRETGFKCTELDTKSNPLNNPQFMRRFHHLEDDYEWAFVQTNNVDSSAKIREESIRVSQVDTPYKIFGTIEKFDDLYEELQEELNNSVKSIVDESYGVDFDPFFQKGLVVAVKDLYDKSWCRGLILDAHAINGDNVYDMLLVDIGDVQKDTSSKELFPILRTLVTKLPFQAICFELGHVVPKESKEWSEEAIGRLKDITIDENGGLLLDVVALKKMKSTSYRIYAAVMFNSAGKDLGEILECDGFAEFHVSGKETVELVKKNLLTAWNELYEKHKASQLDVDEDPASDPESDELDVVGFDNPNTLEPLLDSYRNGRSSPAESTAEDVNSAGPAPEDVNETDELVEASEFKSSQNASADRNGSIIGSHVPSSCSEINDGLGASIAHPSDATAIKPSASSRDNIKNPQVYWRQTIKHFILRVDHPDIREYKIDINKKQISFRTVFPPDYGFNMECYGTILDSPKVFVTGQYIQITIRKRTIWMWPRPCTQQGKIRWLKEDLMNADLDEDLDSSDEGHKVFELPLSDEDSDSDSSSACSDDELQDYIAETASYN